MILSAVYRNNCLANPFFCDLINRYYIITKPDNSYSGTYIRVKSPLSHKRYINHMIRSLPCNFILTRSTNTTESCFQNRRMCQPVQRGNMHWDARLNNHLWCVSMFYLFWYIVTNYVCRGDEVKPQTLITSCYKSIVTEQNVEGFEVLVLVIYSNWCWDSRKNLCLVNGCHILNFDLLAFRPSPYFNVMIQFHQTKNIHP